MNWIKTVLFSILMATSAFSAPGLPTPYPNVLEGIKDGGYMPNLGYVWATDNPNDLRVVWRPNMLYPRLHLMTGNQEGLFKPEDGYRWKDSQWMPQISVGELASVLAVAAAVQTFSEKMGRDLDRFIPEKGPSHASRPHESSPSSGGNRGHSGGAGTGGGRSTGRDAQDRK